MKSAISGLRAAILGCTLLMACASDRSIGSLSLSLDDTRFNREHFEVTAKITLSNESSAELSNISCYSWQSPHTPDSSWGGGLLTIQELAANERTTRDVAFVRGRMQFERIFRRNRPSHLKIHCSFTEQPNSATETITHTFLLDTERGQYVEHPQMHSESEDPAPSVPACAGSIANMIPLTAPPGQAAADPSEQWRTMARMSAEAVGLRERWDADPEKRDRLRDLLHRQDRYGLADTAGVTKDGLIDLRGFSCLKCVLRGIDLTEVDLSFSRIQGEIDRVDFSGSKLWASTLSGSVLSHAWMLDTKAAGLDLSSSLIIDADFTRADLYAADFRAARVPFGTFYDVCLTGATFDNATLDAWWRQAGLRFSSWKGTSIAGFIDNSDLTGADFRTSTVLQLSFIGGSRIDLESLSGIDFSHGSVGPESFQFEADLLGTQTAAETGRRVGLLRGLVAKAVDTGNHELIDLFYYRQRATEVASMTYGPRWFWEWIRGWVAGWGTRPGLALRTLTYLWMLSWFCYGLISILSSKTSGVFEGGKGTPVTTRATGMGFARHWLGTAWDLAVFSLVTITRLSFDHAATEKEVAGALALRRGRLEARGVARRVAALEWIVSKLVVFLLLECLLKQYWL